MGGLAMATHGLPLEKVPGAFSPSADWIKIRDIRLGWTNPKVVESFPAVKWILGSLGLGEDA